VRRLARAVRQNALLRGGGRPPGRPGRDAPGAKANFHGSERINGGMPEVGRVSRHPLLAVFGRAHPYGALWKPDLLKE
jgi:hypothetical protein